MMKRSKWVRFQCNWNTCSVRAQFMSARVNAKWKHHFFFIFQIVVRRKIYLFVENWICVFFSHFQIVQLKTWFSRNYHYVHGNRAWNTVCRIYVHVVVVVVVKSFVVVRLFCFYVELFCVHHRHLPPMMRIVVIFIYLRSFFFIRIHIKHMYFCYGYEQIYQTFGMVHTISMSHLKRRAVCVSSSRWEFRRKKKQQHIFKMRAHKH